MAKDKKDGAPPSQEVVEAKEMPRRGDPFDGLRVEDMKPYTTSEELPEDRVEWGGGKNTAGQAVGTRVIYCGAPRFYLSHVRTNPAGLVVYNLIGKYRNGKGVGSRNLRTLKIMKSNKKSTGMSRVLADDRKRDAQWFDTLTKVNKIPVYAIGQEP